MEKIPTVYDVAAQAGVSIATVSRVLRRPHAVRPSTRDQVLAAVRDLGYVPSANARGLAARRTGVLGLYFPSFDAVEDVHDLEFEQNPSVDVVVDIPDDGAGRPLDLYFDEVLRGGELEAWRSGFALMVGVGRSANPEVLLNDIAGRVDGLVALAQSAPSEVLQHISRRVPVVLMAGPRRGDDFDHVSVANAEGMSALVRHLVRDLGVRELTFISGPRDSPDDAERFEGYRQALTASDIDPDGMPVLHGDFSRTTGRKLAAQLVEGGRLPRAIVCSNDQTALGVLEVLATRGVHVPADTIVTGFDGIEEGRLSSPRLTTVHQPMLDLGRAAIQVMRRRLEDPEQPPISLRLPVRVYLRESSEGASRPLE